MQIKAADNKDRDIHELQGLLRRPDPGRETRAQIDQEIRNIRAGSKAEQDAAYQMEFHLSDNPRIMTIHDLRIECEGRVAQIDHVVITSLFDVWLCESKHFSRGVSINEYGEWSAYYRGGLSGIPSPIEQNKKHAVVLDDVLRSGRVDLPRRLGIARRPTIKTVVLVSKDARIDRPKATAAAHVEGLESVIKCDQFISVMDQSIEKKSARDFMLGLAWLGTIETFARQLAALHKPIRMDWNRKFELTPDETARVHEMAKQPALRALSLSPPRSGRNSPFSPGGSCESCGRSLSAKEVAYCQMKKSQLRARMLCYGCQRSVRQIS